MRPKITRKKMNKDKMTEWMATHNTGASSITMWAALAGIKPTKIWFGIPYDADDFSRCYDLVKFCEISPDEDLPKILQVFPMYAPIIREWHRLSELFEDGDYRGVNLLLKELRQECYSMKNK